MGLRGVGGEGKIWRGEEQTHLLIAMTYHSLVQNCSLPWHAPAAAVAP